MHVADMGLAGFDALQLLMLAKDIDLYDRNVL